MNYVIPVWAVLLSWLILSFHVTHIYFSNPKGSIQAHANDHGWGCVIKGYVFMMILWPYFMVRRLNAVMEMLNDLKRDLQHLRSQTRNSDPTNLPPEVQRIIDTMRADGHRVIVTDNPEELFNRIKGEKGE